jgi:hypothetical protein
MLAIASQGLPPEWGRHLPDGVSKDEAKVTATDRHVAPPQPTPEVRRTLNPMRKFSWWKKDDGKAPLAGTVIGSPFNVQHTTHVRGAL